MAATRPAQTPRAHRAPLAPADAAAGRRADPAGEPLARRAAALHAQPRRARRRRASSSCSSLFCLFARSSRRTTRTTRLHAAYQSPSAAHPFGTDQSGRDLMTRAALGGRVSIGIGFAATLTILADRRHLRLDLGLRRRQARQRADALPRRALRAAVPAVRDHHARDLRRRQLLDDGGRALDRELVHGRAHRARPDDHAQGERLRPRREGASARAGTACSGATCCRTRSAS